MDNVQIIRHGEIPVAAIIPWEEYQNLLQLQKSSQKKDDTIPHEVVERIFLKKESPIKAWRTYLHFTQSEVARKMGISQAAFSQIEKTRKNQRATLEKVADAMGLCFDQLDAI